MESETVSVTNAAAVAGLQRGTLASWRSRGHVPQREYDLADALSLALAADLVAMGLNVETAAAVGWGVREDWGRVIAAGNSRLFLLARLGEDGRWLFAVCPQREIPTPPIGGTIQVDLTHIAKRVLTRLREMQGA
jgi:hypothetical protein